MTRNFPKAGQKVSEQKFCPSWGSHLKEATVSVNEVIQYLRGDAYMSANAAAEYLGLSQRFLQRRLSEIPYYRPGTKKLFKRSDLDCWMEQYRRQPGIQKDLKRVL